MDDLLLLHQDRDYLERSTLQIGVYLQCLGWTLSTKKCEFTPAHTIRFLGWVWSFEQRTLRMTPTMQNSVRRLLHMWEKKIKRQEPANCKKLGALTGSLNFLRAQIPRASLYLRGLHSELTRGVRSSGWSGSFTMRTAALSEIRFWLLNVNCNTPYCFIPRVSQATLTTDASEPGWGAELCIGNARFDTFGFYSQADLLSSSNQRETEAVLRAILFFRPLFRANNIHAMTLRSDNAATVCNIQRQGAGLALLKQTRAIFSALMKLDIRVRVMHLPGAKNVHVDALSRMEVTGDYSLKREVFRRGVEALGVTPTIDLFAHAENAQLPRFASLPGPRQGTACALDAFTVDWTGETPYAFPPVQLVPEVLLRLRESRITAVVVAPNWPGQAWWSTLKEMAERWVELGESEAVLEPGPTMRNSNVTLKLPPGSLLMALISPLAWDNTGATSGGK
jgi:hypothetical protein